MGWVGLRAFIIVHCIDTAQEQLLKKPFTNFLHMKYIQEVVKGDMFDILWLRDNQI